MYNNVDKTYGVVDAAPSVDETEEDTLQSKPLGMSVGGLVADYESGEEEEEEEEGHEHKAPALPKQNSTMGRLAAARAAMYSSSS